MYGCTYRAVRNSSDGPSVRALSYNDGRGVHLLGGLVLFRSRLGCPRLEGQVTDGDATGACNECLW
jgi:hypothetical protein